MKDAICYENTKYYIHVKNSVHELFFNYSETRVKNLKDNPTAIC